MSTLTKVGKNTARLGIVTAFAATGVMGTAVASQAVIPCEGQTAVIKKHEPLWRPAANMPIFSDGPGGTMSASVTKATQVTSTWGTSVEAEIGALFAKVKTTVSYSVTRTSDVTIGHTYTRKISKGRFGNVEYGSKGYRVSWQIRKNVQTADGGCKPGSRVLKSGVAKVPTKQQGWRYFETSH